MEGYKLLCDMGRYKYYVKDGMLARASKNTFVVLGYLEDNLRLYKRLLESI